MGLLKFLFGKRPIKNNKDDLPPLFYGGDALSPKTAAILNCASMRSAYQLMDRFVSKQHGQKGVNWEPCMSYFVDDPSVPPYTIRAFSITVNQDKSLTYFFNVSTPINETKALMKVMGHNPDIT